MAETLHIGSISQIKADQVAAEGTNQASSIPGSDTGLQGLSDAAERRRIGNRIAQRNFRRKLKSRLEQLGTRAEEDPDADDDQDKDSDESSVLEPENVSKLAQSSPLEHKAPFMAASGRDERANSKLRLTKEQQEFLEGCFQTPNQPTTGTKQGFAERLGVSLDDINNWFQNRRAKDDNKTLNQSSDNLFSDPKTWDHFFRPSTAFDQASSDSELDYARIHARINYDARETCSPPPLRGRVNSDVITGVGGGFAEGGVGAYAYPPQLDINFDGEGTREIGQHSSRVKDADLILAKLEIDPKNAVTSGVRSEDDEDILNDIGSSTRRLLRRVRGPGHRSSLIFEDMVLDNADNVPEVEEGNDNRAPCDNGLPFWDETRGSGYDWDSQQSSYWPRSTQTEEHEVEKSTQDKTETTLNRVQQHMSDKKVKDTSINTSLPHPTSTRRSFGDISSVSEERLTIGQQVEVYSDGSRSLTTPLDEPSSAHRREGRKTLPPVKPVAPGPMLEFIVASHSDDFKMNNTIGQKLISRPKTTSGLFPEIKHQTLSPCKECLKKRIRCDGARPRCFTCARHDILCEPAPTTRRVLQIRDTPDHQSATVCVRCRNRKAYCNRVQPTCSSCAKAKVLCIYPYVPHIVKDTSPKHQVDRISASAKSSDSLPVVELEPGVLMIGDQISYFDAVESAAHAKANPLSSSSQLFKEHSSWLGSDEALRGTEFKRRQNSRATTWVTTQQKLAEQDAVGENVGVAALTNEANSSMVTENFDTLSEYASTIEPTYPDTQTDSPPSLADTSAFASSVPSEMSTPTVRGLVHGESLSAIEPEKPYSQESLSVTDTDWFKSGASTPTSRATTLGETRSTTSPFEIDRDDVSENMTSSSSTLRLQTHQSRYVVSPDNVESPYDQMRRFSIRAAEKIKQSQSPRREQDIDDAIGEDMEDLGISSDPDSSTTSENGSVVVEHKYTDLQIGAPSHLDPNQQDLLLEALASNTQNSKDLFSALNIESEASSTTARQKATKGLLDMPKDSRAESITNGTDDEPYHSRAQYGRASSPRTTRRNMLQAELTQELRQNLLWERQTALRLLGKSTQRVTSGLVDEAYRSRGMERLCEEFQAKRETSLKASIYRHWSAQVFSQCQLRKTSAEFRATRERNFRLAILTKVLKALPRRKNGAPWINESKYIATAGVNYMHPQPIHPALLGATTIEAGEHQQQEQAAVEVLHPGPLDTAQGQALNFAQSAHILPQLVTMFGRGKSGVLSALLYPTKMLSDQQDWKSGASSSDQPTHEDGIQVLKEPSSSERRGLLTPKGQALDIRAKQEMVDEKTIQQRTGIFTTENMASESDLSPSIPSPGPQEALGRDVLSDALRPINVVDDIDGLLPKSQVTSLCSSVAGSPVSANAQFDVSAVDPLDAHTVPNSEPTRATEVTNDNAKKFELRHEENLYLGPSIPSKVSYNDWRRSYGSYRSGTSVTTSLGSDTDSTEYTESPVRYDRIYQSKKARMIARIRRHETKMPALKEQTSDDDSLEQMELASNSSRRSGKQRKARSENRDNNPYPQDPRNEETTEQIVGREIRVYEKLLQFAFSKTLHIDIDQIDRRSNFYHLGGNSLTALSLIQEARELGVEISWVAVLEWPVLGDMAAVAKEILLEPLSLAPNVNTRPSDDETKMLHKLEDISQQNPSRRLAQESDLKDSKSTIESQLNMAWGGIRSLPDSRNDEGYNVKWSDVPYTETEQLLRRAFSRAFDVKLGAIHGRSSFIDLGGGDSLASLRLIHEARELGVRVSLPDVYRRPVLKDMALAAVLIATDTHESDIVSEIEGKLRTFDVGLNSATQTPSEWEILQSPTPNAKDQRSSSELSEDVEPAHLFDTQTVFHPDDWKEVQKKLPESWMWDVDYHVTSIVSTSEPPHGCWTCTPIDDDDPKSFPLTIAGAPVVLPVEYTWPPVAGVNPPPDPRPSAPIDCTAELPLEVIRDLFLTFEGSLGFYILINGVLQILVGDEFDTAWASSHLPHKYGGLKVCYIAQNMELTMFPSTASLASKTETMKSRASQTSTSASALGSSTSFFRPSSSRISTNVLTPSLQLNDFIEARTKSSHRKEKFAGRIGAKVVKDGEQYLVMSSHVITEAILAKGRSKAIFGRGKDRVEKLEGDWNEHVEIWAGNEKIGTIDQSFDPSAEIYPDGFMHDITLVKPTSLASVKDIQSPIPSLGWLSRESWHTLRQQSSSVHILGDTETHRAAKTLKTNRPSEVLVVGEGIFLNQTASPKPTKDQDMSTWKDLVSRALLYRVYPDFDPPNGYSGIALYADGLREDGTTGPGIVGFQSFVQRSGHVQNFEMEGGALEKRLKLGRVAFYGAFQVPDVMRQEYGVV